MKPQLIKDIRAFNRFYTNITGLLERHILNSSYSLPEVRIMYELYHHEGLTASDIITLLRIDKGYLSRILKNFQKNKLVAKVISATDNRIAVLQLTAKGKKQFEILNNESDRQVENIFNSLSEKEGDYLVRKMQEIQQLINRKVKI